MSVKPGKLLSGEQLVQSHINNDKTLPKTGEKQFKPMNTWVERRRLDRALEESRNLLQEERVEKIGALAQAKWYNSKRLAEVTRKVGKHFQTMGFEKDGKLFIYPEEALYLMEMNCLQLSYHNVPLSIQQGYSLLLSSQGCSLKEYRTYSHLTKQGYRLLRHNKRGMATYYEQKIRLDQHVPQKRIFPEADVVTLEPVSDDLAASSGISEKEGSPPISERSETNDSSVKSENDSTEVSEPMKNFAKSIADMGKSLVKTENSEGSDGLGFESLRKKILDMLEDHFQGHISPEAMHAVSLSASKAIMVHVDDHDSEKTCDAPNLNDSVDTSVCPLSSSLKNEDCSVKCEAKSPDEEDSVESVLSVREGDAGVSEEGRLEESGEAAQAVEYEVIERRMDEESREAAQTTTNVVTEKTVDEDTGEAAQTTTTDVETKKTVDKESGEAAHTTTNVVTEKTVDEDTGGAAQTTTTDVETKKTVDKESGEAAQTTTNVVTEKTVDEDTEGAAQTTTTDVETKKTVDKESGEAAQTTTNVVTEKRVDEDTGGAAQTTTTDVETKKTVDKESGEAAQTTTNVVTEKTVNEESGKVVQTTDGVTEKRMDEEPLEGDQKMEKKVQESDKAAQTETQEITEKRIEEKTEEAVTEKVPEKITNQESEQASLKRKTMETDVSETDRRRRRSASTTGAGTSDVNCSKSKEASTMQLSKPLSKTECNASAQEMRCIDGETSEEETDLEEEMEVEYPVEGSCTSGSDSSEEESHTDVLGSTTGQSDMQIDDDVMEIEDPNTWKNIKVETSPNTGNNDPQKKSFSDSNGWRSLKQAYSKTQTYEHDGVGIVAVRNAKDVEVIDISEESCVKAIQESEAKLNEEIEIVDLDESDSNSDSSSGNPDVKQEKLPTQRTSYATTLGKTRKECSVRPHLASAFERARDSKRKYIMDCFPNMFQRGLCSFDVPPRNLLPPNVTPMRHAYTITRRALAAERPLQSFNPPRRPFHPPKVNNYYNNQPRPFQPRQPFRPPGNMQPWQGLASAPINPAALQAFQMITSIVLPMFGLNNMGPRFMRPPQWNQGPTWHPPQRNWQNQQQWRFHRPPNQWNNRHNRPWYNNRNSEREQQDFVLDRPKRPTLLPTHGFPPAAPVWQDERSSQEPRRPKRPFVIEDNARELLLDIEEEARWKKIKTMEEESDSDNESEVTITPINRTPTTSDLHPLLKLENCKSSSEIMASIDVIKRADPRSLNTTAANRRLKISYDLFLPNIPFRKSSPPTPNFRLCIMSVEELAPNPGEISMLLERIHDGVPLMFGVVSPDIISYYQYATIDLPKQTFSS